MMTKLAFSLLAVAGGVAAALQAAANAGLASRIGLGAALVVNTTIVLLGTLALFVVKGPHANFFPAGAPAQLYVGGLCGFVIVLALAFVFPKIGAGYAVALVVLGQGATALAIDHFGWLGMPAQPFTIARAAGLALVGGGVLLMRL
jgi:transporter family-2 protein